MGATRCGAAGAALADVVADGALAAPLGTELAATSGAVGGELDVGAPLTGGSELTTIGLGRRWIATAPTPRTTRIPTTLTPTRSAPDPVFPLSARGTSRCADTAGAGPPPAASISVSASDAGDPFAPGDDTIADRADGEMGERGSIDSGSVVDT